MAQKINTGLVFLKEELIADHIKTLEVREKQYIIEQPKVATEETLIENGLTLERVSEILGTKESGWNAYEYKWRFATKKEWNAAVKRNGGVFQII